MKLNLAIPGLLIALLVGCNDTTTVATSPSPSATPSPTATSVVSKKTPTSTPTATNSPNPFDSVSFPQASCGDKLPKNAKADNFKFYPVFEGWGSNVDLEIVRSKFCGDAIQKYRIDKGYQSLQFASFTSEERANQFKQFLATKLVNAEVGVPTVRVTKSTKPQPTKDAVAKAAQLTPQQVEQLKNIIFKDTLGKPHKVEAILPTYLPPGFKLDSFKGPADENFGNKYEIVYKNASNKSFKITTYAPGPGAGGPPYAPKLKAVNSPAFGEVIIGYKEFDTTSDKSSIDVSIRARPPLANNISENSPSDGDSSAWSYDLHSDTLSLAEATKIVESLSYLYPDEPRNLTFSNDLSNDPQWAPQ